MIRPHQKQPLWLAFAVHRMSGIGLALFLPAHFYILGTVMKDAQPLDTFLHWSELPIVRVAETGLVFLLAVHCFGGLRLLALEFLPWTPYQKTLAALAASLAFFFAVSFLLNGL
jgi:fumarate reductase subunit D